MKLKPLAPLLCLFIAVPGLSVAAEKTVYGLNDYARINDPDLAIDEDAILVIRGAGPLGWPVRPRWSTCSRPTA